MPTVVRINADEIEFDVGQTLLPSVMRALSGETPLDVQVDALGVSDQPTWLRTAVLALRWYRHHLGTHFAHRCGFDPSCSRYAELAFRNRGLLPGLRLTAGRLLRCRPGAGGVDLP